MNMNEPREGLAQRFCRVAVGLPVEPLRLSGAAWPDLWLERTERQTEPGSPHAMTQSIFLRAPEELSVRSMFNELNTVPYPRWELLKPALLPVLVPLLLQLNAQELGRVLLVRLRPGGSIPEHVDEGAYAEYYDRFHICVDAEQPGNEFTVGGTTVLMYPGEAWWFNHKRPHSVVNKTSSWRTHLVVDARTSYREQRGRYCQEELLSGLWLELLPLLEAHWAEIARYPDVPLDPDIEAYTVLEQSGQLHGYTMREAGRLIGYAFYFVRPNLHYRGSLQAMQDVFYVVPEHRARAAQLLRYSERRLRELGVQVVHQHAKRLNQFAALLGALGYELSDDILSKRLDKET